MLLNKKNGTTNSNNRCSSHSSGESFLVFISESFNLLFQTTCLSTLCLSHHFFHFVFKLCIDFFHFINTWYFNFFISKFFVRTNYFLDLTKRFFYFSASKETLNRINHLCDGCFQLCNDFFNCFFSSCNQTFSCFVIRFLFLRIFRLFHILEFCFF